MTHFLKLAALSALVGCGSGGGSTNHTNPDGNPGSVDADLDTGGLDVVSLTTTVATVTGGAPLAGETNSVDFVAIVTDPAGLDTIAGGQLLDGNGTTYGAFQAAANRGTYTATLTYAQINQTVALDFAIGMGKRSFVAKFFDNAGHMATASVVLGLACRDGGGLEGACGGTCSNAMQDPLNCGGCGMPCSVGKACGTGQCVAVAGVCVPVQNIAATVTCDQVCTAAGMTCTANDGGETFENPSCSGNPQFTVGCGDQLTGGATASFGCQCG